MGSKEGAAKAAARRLKLTLTEYLARLEAGDKWCHACEQWKPVGAFGIDTTRGDRRAAVCKRCRYHRLTPGPSKAERREMRKSGLAWCRQCHGWLPAHAVHAGLCRTHANEEARRRYAEDERYRRQRRQHAHSRKRRIEPIPLTGQEILLEDFGGKCAYCGGPAETWDHILPISRGGRTTPGNVVSACYSCNSSKKDRDVFEWTAVTGRIPCEAFFDRLVLAEAGLHG